MAADDFTKNVQGMITGGFAGLAISIGSQKGIFKFMAEHDDKPMTSVEIAKGLGMKERYIREWLALMASSKVVDVDASGTAFTFPRARLTNMPGLGVAATLLATCGEAYSRVRDCFSEDGPQGLSHMQNNMYYDCVETLGEVFGNWESAKSWIAKTPNLQEKLDGGISVLEVGCGRGRYSAMLAEQYPKSTFYAFDVFDEAVEKAKIRAKGKNLANVTFEKRSLYDLPSDWEGKWEVVLVYNVIHDLPNPQKGLDAIYKLIQPGGSALIVDFIGHSSLKDNLPNPGASTTLYGVSLFICMTDSLSVPGGQGLGTVMGEEVMVDMAKKAGFKVTVGDMPEGHLHTYYVCLK